MTPLLIFETHPVQYRCPIYQELQRIRPSTFKVIFASDFSVRGYSDQGFGKKISWDTPLLNGYNYQVLGNDRPGGINRWSGLSGDGISELFTEHRPSAILLSSFGYNFSHVAHWNAKKNNVPIWIRMETQDEAVSRSPVKSLIRTVIYRNVYKTVSRFFTIGEINKQHYLRHGVTKDRMRTANYCTLDPVGSLSNSDKIRERTATRNSLGLNDKDRLIGFFGKLIPKKNPVLILEAWKKLCGETRARTKILFVGSGELEFELQARAREEAIPVAFAGFVNQSELGQYYLATDILVLPSRKLGETWGLVVNEGLHAGCSVITSEHVGCQYDFKGLDRYHVFEDGNADELAVAIEKLINLSRDFFWAQEIMKKYSVHAAAESFAHEIDCIF